MAENPHLSVIIPALGPQSRVLSPELVEGSKDRGTRTASREKI